MNHIGPRKLADAFVDLEQCSWTCGYCDDRPIMAPASFLLRLGVTLGLGLGSTTIVLQSKLESIQIQPNICRGRNAVDVKVGLKRAAKS
jgi:hypothetical protein